MQSKKINLLIAANLALILLALCLVSFTEIDVKIQNYFFDFETKLWLIDRDEPIKKFIFYKFPKILLGAAILYFLGLAINAFKKNSPQKKKFLLIFLGLALIPAIAGNIKKFTNVYCPNQLEIYDGDKPYVKIFESYPENFVQKKRGQCFPAGHAITGFSLMILFFALEKKSHRFLGLFAGIFFGWLLGIYQILKGAHFFGDTLLAMLVCFLIAALIAKFFKNDQ